MKYKISEIEGKLNNHNHDKYITTPEFNTLAAGVFHARLRLANLVTKTDFDTKLKGLSDRITSNKTKHLLVETELKKLKTFDVAYFKSKNYFGNYFKNYLVFDTITSFSNLLVIPFLNGSLLECLKKVLTT